MTFFLLMLLFLGFLFTWHFSNQLPPVFLAIISPMIGILFFTFNLIFLLVLRIPINLQFLWILLGVEGFIMVLNLFRLRNKLQFTLSLFLFDVLSGLATVAIAIIFYQNNFSFASNDTFYMLIMARDILETGLVKWHFASPSGMGIFASLLQIIGLLFQNEYTWFIQPLISFFFYVLFFYFGVRAGNKYNISPFVSSIVIVLIIAVMLTSNLLGIFTFYIHSNFLSGIFLFLSFVTILSYLEDKKGEWLIFSTIFIISFGLCRLENSVFVCVLIMLLLAEGKIEWKIMLSTFGPFLVLQSFWFFIIYSLQTSSSTDQMSPTMILLVMCALIFVFFLLIVLQNRKIYSFLTKIVTRYLPYFLILLFALLLITKWESTIENIVTLLENSFIFGNWYLFWVFFLIISIFVGVYSPKIEHQRLYLFLILFFFMQIIVLGALREPYHLNWTDSSNRMLIHIIPIMLFFIIEKLFAWINKTKLTTQNENIAAVN